MSMRFPEQWFKDRFGVDAPAKGGRFTPPAVKKAKYGNVKDGKHDSKRESKRARELHAMQRAGLIHNLQEQVPFVLIPSQRGEDGKVIERSVRYIADFVYTQDGRQVVEDSKGFKTPEYIIKRKMLLWFHGIRVREV